MNREDIIRMAREAGGADISMNGWTSWVGTQSTEFLERFAELVASAERNRTWTQAHWTEYERAIVAQEREACAKLVDHILKEGGGTWGEAIRARGQA
jgi:hypothetical protein